MKNEFHEIIKEICDEENINFSLLSKDWVIKLEKNNKVRFIAGYKFGVNDHSLGEVLDDKYATYEVLTSLNIPIIKHKIVFNSNNQNEYAIGSNSQEIIREFFEEHDNNIVIKANEGTCGNEVFHVTILENLTFYTDKLFKKNFSISICPFYDIITEYRAIVVDGEVELLYGKVKPVVFGDGIHSLKELLQAFNLNYFSNPEKLAKIDADYVPKKDEMFEYNWQFNLSGGASITMKIDEGTIDNVEKLAIDTAKKLNIRFGSVDIIKTVDEKYLVLEINSGVMMKNFVNIHKDGRNIAKNIYKKVIKKMFEL